MRIESSPIQISIVHFGPIQNPTTNLSWRSGFLSKFDHILIIVNRFWSFIQLESIKIDHFWSFPIKRTKKTIYMSIIWSNKLDLIENVKNPVVFDHFRLESNYFWLNLTFWITIMSEFVLSGRIRLNLVTISDPKIPLKYDLNTISNEF